MGKIKEPIRPITWFIVGTAVIFIIGFFSFQTYRGFQQQIQQQRIESEKRNKEQQDLLLKQQNDIEQTKKEVENLKNKKPQVIIKDGEVPVQNFVNNEQISSSEIKPYLSGVGEIFCAGSDSTRGSSSLWYFEGIGYTVLTNKHVITTNNCDLLISDTAEDTKNSGIYNLGTETYNWNSKTDVAVLKIASLNIAVSTPISSLNYKISYLSKCSTVMAIGSPVVVVGYPAFAETLNDYGKQTFLTMTNGIISAQDTSVRWGIGKLPYPNYFVSAKIDSGSSGGMAFSKDSKGLCLLGIPTWVSVGNYETQGVIQNIHNIFYSE